MLADLVVRGPGRVASRTLPGEQAQFPGGERALWLFVIVLGHSRAMWGELVLDLSVHSRDRFLAGRTIAGVAEGNRVGYLPCDTRAADILYNIVSRRHEQRSTIITTKLAFKQWATRSPALPA